jgi:hypothetical protein
VRTAHKTMRTRPALDISTGAFTSAASRMLAADDSAQLSSLSRTPIRGSMTGSKRERGERRMRSHSLSVAFTIPGSMCKRHKKFEVSC